MTPDPHETAQVAKALSHPARLRILRVVAEAPGCIGGDIVGAVGLAQSTVSEHLRILRSAGLLVGEIDPPRICYSLNPHALAPLRALLDTLSQKADGETCHIPAAPGGSS